MLKNINIDDNNILFSPEIGNSYQLNEISKNIIKKIRIGENDEEIIKDISDEYNISKDDVYIDYMDFKTKLKVYGLL